MRLNRLTAAGWIAAAIIVVTAVAAIRLSNQTGRSSVDEGLARRPAAILGSLSSASLAGARGVAIAGPYAYVTGQNAGQLSVIDVADPRQPSGIGLIRDPALDGATGIALSGHYAYVTNRRSNRLIVIDIADPGHLMMTGSVGHPMLRGAAKVVVRAHYAYVTAFDAGAVVAIDVADPAAPVVTGWISNSRSLDDADGIDVSGNHAFVVGGSPPAPGRFAVIDVSDPHKPQLVGKDFDQRLEGAAAVKVVGSYAYVAAADADALTVVDVSNLQSPRVVSSLTTGTGTKSPTADLRDIVISGNLAYVVGQANARFTAIDISDPLHLRLTGSITDLQNLLGARAVALSDHFAYVAAYDRGRLTIVDVRKLGADTAAQPAVAGSIR